MDRFLRPPTNLDEIRSLIVKTTIGSTTWKEFGSASQGDRIKIEPYPADIRSRLAASADQGHPIGALFVTDGKQGVIYLDLLGELGVLLPYLFHEMIHSLDESLWNAASTSLSKGQKKEIIFKSECKAFYAQNLFMEELKTVFPELRKFYSQRYPQIPFLNRPFLPHEIAELYAGIESLL